MTVTPQPPAQPPKTAARLGTRERWWAMIIGALSGGAGGVATFTTENGTGAAALLGVGALFFMVGLLRLKPKSLKMGGAEAEFDQEIVAEVAAQANDPDIAPESRDAARAILARATQSALGRVRTPGVTQWKGMECEQCGAPLATVRYPGGSRCVNCGAPAPGGLDDPT